MNDKKDTLIIAGKEFTSRLFIGTGKYATFQQTKEALALSGAQVVTVAVRRVNLDDKSKESLLDYIDGSKYFILPNTAGCYTWEDAVRTAKMSREILQNNWVKLEVIGNEKTLMPDVMGTLKAAEVLLKEGFVVLPYTSDDHIVAKKLEEMGCPAVMPLAAPIGSGLGIRNPHNVRIIIEMSKVPVVVDAGVGTASDAAEAMELGCDAVLINTSIAKAKNPLLMAEAMKHAVDAGRKAYLAGRIPKKLYASASSPIDGVIGT